MPKPSSVYFFATCVVDLMAPQAGMDAIALLRDAGLRVEFPQAQSCCGQPAYNSGHRAEALKVARAQLPLFPEDWPIIVPSGSCAGMIKVHYPSLFAGEPGWTLRAERLAAKTHELTAFLSDVLGVGPLPTAREGTATYHDSCSGLRELGVKDQPRKLLAAVDGLTVKEMRDPESCCGFGGTFCVKYPEISNAIVGEKADAIDRSGASLLLGGDLGCLMNMAGKLKREGSPIKVRHVAEVLAGDTATPAIGEGG